MLIFEDAAGALGMLLKAVDGNLALLLEDAVGNLEGGAFGNLELLSEGANGNLLLLSPDGFMFITPLPLASGLRSERCWMKVSKLEKSSFECVCKR